MRILLIYHGGGRGGDATVCFDLIGALEHLGHQVDFFAHCFEEEAFRGRIAQRGLSCTIMPSLKLLVKHVRKDAGKYDVVHFHTANEWPLFNIEALPLRRAFPRRKLFCTVHGSRSLLELCKNKRYKMSAQLAIRCFNKVIAPSQHKVRDWLSLLGSQQNIIRIPNPVQPLPCLSKDESRRQLNIPFGSVVVSFVGILRPEKGIIELLSAARNPLFARWIFLVAGNGELEESIQEQVEKYGLPVRLLGYLKDPAPVYRAADIFCFPSTQENYPIALLQAVGGGIPTVAADIPVVVDELNYPGAVFAFKAGDIDSLTEVLIEASQNADVSRCQKMGTELSKAHDSIAIAMKHICIYENAK